MWKNCGPRVAVREARSGSTGCGVGVVWGTEPGLLVKDAVRGPEPFALRANVTG